VTLPGSENSTEQNETPQKSISITLTKESSKVGQKRRQPETGSQI